MNRLNRFFRHLFADRATVRRAFPPAAMKNIEAIIVEQEKRHDGELQFAVEAGLPLDELLDGTGAHERAIELFGQLRVWDTEQNAGVLIYLLLADKRVEIVADRGIHLKVGATAWESICGVMQRAFAEGKFEEGVLIGIRSISDLLAQHFPAQPSNVDELLNRPIVL